MTTVAVRSSDNASLSDELITVLQQQTSRSNQADVINVYRPSLRLPGLSINFLYTVYGPQKTRKTFFITFYTSILRLLDAMVVYRAPSIYKADRTVYDVRYSRRTEPGYQLSENVVNFPLSI